MLDLVEVSRVYQRAGKRIQALEEVNTTFGPGFTSLIGPNGGGKSTLMGIVTTLLSPTSGRILFGGREITSRNRESYRRKIGYVPQQISLIPSMSVYSTLDYVGWTYGMSKVERQRRIGDLLARIQLEEKRDSKIRALSGGQLRRIGIAAGMMGAP